MEKRRFGRTGLEVSVLGFGCGAVGGLMVKGDPADQERAVRRALELGINYFDTAQMYGNGESEKNLGRVFKALNPDAYVGTKVRLPPTEPGRIGEAIAASLEASLKRLQREQVDLFQFHNAIVGTHPRRRFLGRHRARRGRARFPAAARAGQMPLYRHHRQRRDRRLAPGHRRARFDTGQASYNLLNPSPAGAVPEGYPAQDYQNLLGHAEAAGMGIIVIRVLAGGALERHRGAASAWLAAAGADRLGRKLSRPMSSAPAASRRWCRRGMPTA